MNAKKIRIPVEPRTECHGMLAGVGGMMRDRGFTGRDGTLMRDLRGLRVLVVEPDRTLASVLEEALILAGARVVDVCADMAEAGRMRAPEEPDAMVVGTRSHQDPALAARTAQAWGIPFLLTCDQPMDMASARARCLPKPFCIQDLVEGLNGCTSIHEAP